MLIRTAASFQLLFPDLPLRFEPKLESAIGRATGGLPKFVRPCPHLGATHEATKPLPNVLSEILEPLCGAFVFDHLSDSSCQFSLVLELFSLFVVHDAYSRSGRVP